jgi:hypothetical protein
LTTDTIGDITATASSGNYFRGYAITPSASGVLTSVGVNFQTASGNVRVGIYSTVTGTPTFSGLLGQSASTAIVTGWNDLAIPGGVSLVAGTTYYICFNIDNNTAVFYRSTSGNRWIINPLTYAAFVDPTATLTFQASSIANMRIIYTAGSTNVNVSDSGSGLEALSSSVTFGVSDVGSGADSPREGMNFLDNAIGGETPIWPSLQISDSGVGTEVEASSVTFTVGDSGSGADNPIEWMNYADKSNRINVPGGDQNINGLDTGIGVDVLVLQVSFQVDDVGSGGEVFSITFNIADSGFGSDVWGTSSVLTAFDTGSGAELYTLTLKLADVGNGSEAYGLTANWSINDVGSGLESIISKATFTVADVVVGVDFGFRGQWVLISDSGQGTERFAIRVLKSGRLQYTVRLQVTADEFDITAYDPYSYA